jgi:hypothetical protein
MKNFHDFSGLPSRSVFQDAFHLEKIPLSFFFSLGKLKQFPHQGDGLFLEIVRIVL